MKHACAAVLLLALGLAGLSSAAPVAGSPAVSVPSHLVGYWPMDEASGAVLDDCSGGGREGRVLGTPEWVTADRGAAIRLAGKDSGLRIPSNPAWDAGDGELTVALWVKAEPGGGQGFLLDHYFGGVPGVWGLVVQGGAPLFCLYDDAAKPRRLSFPGFDTARWQHLAVVWRRATDGWVRCYLNGKLVDSLDGVACRTKHQDDLYVGVRQGADQRFACSVRDLAIFDRALPAADVAALHETGIVLAAPVVLTALRTDKLLYAPRETGEATLRLKNLSAAPQAVELTLQLVSSLRRERELKRLSLTLAPKSTQTLSASFSSAGEDYGCELRANVSQGGKRLAEQREVFSVAENFATVGIGSDWGGGLHTGLGQHREIPARARQLYSNYFEIFFWSPCDWALHVAPAKQWWSGQASYLEDEDNLKELIARSHEQGIKVAFYASCNPAGPFGWEVARRHPEWFGGGSFDGRYEVEPLEKWNDPAWRKGAKGNPGWFLVSVDLRHLAALDYGIDRIRDSIKAYGWDAVRFDGHYTILGNDPLSTRNMRRLKERVWQDTPGFGFGFNYGRAPEWLGGITHEIREAMAGGGLYLQEGIRNWRYTNDSYTSWRHYGTNELRIAKQLQALGGTYHCMWSDSRLTPDQAYYKLVYGLIAGGHPAASEIYANTPGCPNWGAFMTRWSSMLWHLALRPAEAEQARFTVDAADVQWREWLQERVESPTRKYIIQHLVNPPRSDISATWRRRRRRSPRRRRRPNPHLPRSPAATWPSTTPWLRRPSPHRQWRRRRRRRRRRHAGRRSRTDRPPARVSRRCSPCGPMRRPSNSN